MKHVYQRASHRDGAGKSKRTLRRRRIWMLAALSGALLAGATLAYLSATTNAEVNPFSFGKIGVDIEEEFDGWESKVVQLKNDSEDNVPGVVRAMIVVQLKDENGDGVSRDFDPDNEIELVFDEGWEEHWFFKDGFYYYNQVLMPGDTTPPLLAKVQLADDTPAMRAKYANVTVEVVVMADIIQAANGAPEAAWGVYVTGTTVSPTP